LFILQNFFITYRLKILVKNGQISMKKSLCRFCPIFDEKRHCGVIQFAGGVAGFSKMCVRGYETGFFLKNGAGRVPPRAQPYSKFLNFVISRFLLFVSMYTLPDAIKSSVVAKKILTITMKVR
jgi:hypothetical protein